MLSGILILMANIVYWFLNIQYSKIKYLYSYKYIICYSFTLFSINCSIRNPCKFKSLDLHFLCRKFDLFIFFSRLHSFESHLSTIVLSNILDIGTLWQYGLWSFQTGDTKLEKNQHIQRKLLNFANWCCGELSKIQHHFRK